ncbi:MAG TPA: hypothetical protein VGL99_24100 [Chloroflexota bacterium]
MLDAITKALLRKYRGDLRRPRDVKREHALLQEFSGIGPVGAHIFLREIQLKRPDEFVLLGERDERIGRYKAAQPIRL